MEDKKEHLRKQFAIVAENQLADDIMYYFHEERGEVTADEFIEMFKEEVNNEQEMELAHDLFAASEQELERREEEYLDEVLGLGW